MNLLEVAQAITFNNLLLIDHDFLLVMNLGCRLKLTDTYNARSAIVTNSLHLDFDDGRRDDTVSCSKDEGGG